MKAALNGGLNLSILDGWWDELFDGENGWAITSVEDVEDEAERDRIEADSLFDLLETQIVPLFHDRRGGVPRGWLRRVKSDLATLGPAVVASRMVRDYVTDLYEPTAAAADVLRADDHARARTLAGWKARVAAAWDGVKIDRVDADDEVADLGTARAVEVAVELGSLDPADVAVQALHGPVGALDELADPLTVTDLTCVDPASRPAVYRGEVPCIEPGRYGFTVRVVPTHPDLATPMDLGRITLP